MTIKRHFRGFKQQRGGAPLHRVKDAGRRTTPPVTRNRPVLISRPRPTRDEKRDR